MEMRTRKPRFRRNAGRESDRKHIVILAATLVVSVLVFLFGIDVIGRYVSTAA